MRALVVYCHPCAESFNAAVLRTVLASLEAAGHEIRLVDLYAEGFQPAMNAEERRGYHDHGSNVEPVRTHVENILWCEMLVFVYPTWWFGLPAMLKGWLDRVWVPHVTFEMPTEASGMRPRMQHIRKIAVVTTCGASWWVSKLIGEPGRRTLLRGMRALCAPRCRTLYLAHYKMDSSTSESRSCYLAMVTRRLKRF
ncbi:NAD(P)H-dependent oxidoreductase [Polymorphum gilvum]|uniref:NAD(P)H dehydrogenase (Quinone) n=1 Tax=Polymorphum gilvum (strain LMG 25793 / CGMCC 1.9160 / SL003B-26A1) TaxID=991905 RepID=F2IWC8_POLGS|nr:NAD(P)H-dependent oxidoreductase [Polymorphum gilvum]ADZ69227.1 NAD(P)H dehydrogenase (Quinone) [Polymorphum gilvum SL003B-26A1]